MRKPVHDLPPITNADEARIQAGIATDPDNPEWTEADFDAAKPFGTALPELTARLHRPRGPQRTPKKVPVTIRLNARTVAAFKATGPGWQSRMDAALEAAARLLPEAP